MSGLPIVLIFMLRLVNRKDLMGDKVNSRIMNVVAWVTTVAMIALTLVLIYFAIFQHNAAAGAGLLTFVLRNYAASPSEADWS